MRLPEVCDLTAPRPSSTTLRSLLSAALSVSLGVARELGGAGPALGWYRERVRPRLLAEPGLLSASLLAPSRHTLARLLAFAPRAPSAARAAWEEALAASLALDVATALELDVPITLAAPRTLVDERAGLAFDVPAGDLILTPAGPVVAGARLTGRAAAAELVGPIRLALVDTNPISGLEAHPDKLGNALDLGGKSVDEWRRAVVDALRLIDEHLPALSGELSLMLRHVVPVGYDEERHLSASYLEAVGVVYLTLHPQRMTMVEALIHEFQHNKLNVLLGLDPVLENGETPLYASPVRPDPRPLRGVLLAVHAFQPIALLYEQLRDRAGEGRGELDRRLTQIARTCREGCDVLLPNARPTRVGRALFDEIAELDRRLARHL